VKTQLPQSLLKNTTQTIFWDQSIAENRLVEIDYLGSVSKTTFAYDAYSRRIVRTEMVGSSTTAQNKYVWELFNLAEERDSSGATVTKRYFIDGQQDVALGISRFYAKDHLGSVWETLDGYGNTLSSFSYDPWGRRTRVSGTDYLDIGFTGLYLDYKSGLDIAWLRDYDPNLGRWIRRDPIAERGGLNLYAYVVNGPVDLVDKLGLCGCKKVHDYACQKQAALEEQAEHLHCENIRDFDDALCMIFHPLDNQSTYQCFKDAHDKSDKCHDAASSNYEAKNKNCTKCQ
jgi:RHS repeat-associated protein